jgi:HAD superfamily hydrolase (TIGR01549 family)
LMAGSAAAPRVVETVFLDAGGVLVHPNWQRVSDTLARHGVTVPSAALAAADLRAKWQLDTQITVRTTSDDERGARYFAAVRAAAAVPESTAADAAFAELRRYHAEHNLYESVPDDVAPALSRLRSLDLRLVVVSNANGTVHAQMLRLGLAQHFDLILDSQCEGVEKPDPEIFRRALARSGAAAETTVHVGDLYYVDVMGARAAGIEGWLLDAGRLYPDADCPRVATLAELCDCVQELVTAARAATA